MKIKLIISAHYYSSEIDAGQAVSEVTSNIFNQRRMSKTSHRRIVIGDVHGHYDGLMRITRGDRPGSDEVYFLGDLIDRGPQSAQVVDFVQSSSYHCLLGNHEQMLLEVLDSSEFLQSGADLAL